MEKKISHFSSADRIHLNRLSGFINLIAAVIFVASLFNVPFPFSRILWFKPALGISGLVNSGLLFLIARQIAKVSLPAAFCGLGLIVYDQILTWSGFFLFTSKYGAGWQDWAYLGLSTALSLILTVLISKVLPPVYAYTRTVPRKLYFSQQMVLAEKKTELQMEALVFSIFFYGILFAAMWRSAFMPPSFQFTAFKVLGGAACLLSFVGIGQEISFYLEDLQSKILCAVKVSTHLIMLSAFLYMAFNRIPLRQFLGGI